MPWAKGEATSSSTGQREPEQHPAAVPTIPCPEEDRQQSIDRQLMWCDSLLRLLDTELATVLEMIDYETNKASTPAELRQIVARYMALAARKRNLKAELTLCW